MLSSMPFRIFLLATFFMVLIAGFAWYTATLQYEKNTAHLQFVSPDNELWNEAKQRAVATMDTFAVLHAQYPQSSYVKFAHDAPSGFVEDIWAKVTNLGPGFVGVSIEGRYLKDKNDNPEKELPAGQIVDWMVELPTGEIRGGYTTQALLQLQLEQAPARQEKINADLARFLDKL